MIEPYTQDEVGTMEMLNLMKIVVAFLLGLAIGGALMGAMYHDKVTTYEGDIAKYNKVIRHG